MATLTIRTRITKDDEKRYDVRYRLGGRAYGVQHGGTFETLKDAKIRRDLIGGELAAGRNPKLVLDQLRDPAPVRTFSSWADAYIASRVDVSAATKEHTKGALKRLRDAFGDTEPADITPSMVQEWIASLDLKPSSVRSYVGTLRRVLDYAAVDPNPARDRRVRLPRDTRDVIEPPSADNVAAIIANVPPRWRSQSKCSQRRGCAPPNSATLSGATSTRRRAGSASATARPRPRDAGSQCPRS